jgi:hypothetical protein
VRIVRHLPHRNALLTEARGPRPEARSLARTVLVRTGMAIPLAAPAYQAPRAKRGTGTGLDVELARAQKISRALDTYMLDPILGLVLPGAGDLISSMISLALRRGVSKMVVARMLLNLAVDALVGMIPLAGDLFDVGFKANQRNLALLTDRAHQGGKATAKDWLAVVGAALVFVSVIGLVIYALVAAVRAIV